MFGYIKPAAPEMKVKEYQLYRAFYCGLCRSMCRTATCLSSLTLSYDFVFLALIRSALSDEELSVDSGRCIAHPMQKRDYITHNDTLAYCAAASAVLMRGKVLDDIADSRGLGKTKGYLMLPAANMMVKKAAPPPPLTEYVNDRLAALAEMEQRHQAGAGYSADEGAELFGQLLSRVCAYGLEGAKERIATEIGLHTGRFIYLLDAADDLKEDLKKGRYNPFTAENGFEPERLQVALTMELKAVAAAAALIEFRESAVQSIVENILYLGMPQALEQVISGKPAKERRQQKPIGL